MLWPAMQDDTAALIARSNKLHDDLAAVWATSTALIDAGRRRRQTSDDPRDRPLRGGSGADAGLITRVILGARLCPSCIARKTGVPADQVNSLLRTIAGSLRLRVGPHRCDACLQHKTTFSVAKNGQP
jgi:hypothetical protein